MNSSQSIIKDEGLVKPVLANYGLLDKSHFK